MIAKFDTFCFVTLTKLAESLAAVAHTRELSARLSTVDKLLLERTTELNAAQAFLTEVDAVSEAELFSMTDNLGNLISSASGTLSDAWDQRGPLPGVGVEESDLKQIRNEFSSSVLNHIAARNSVAVTLAIQIHHGYFIKRATSGWGSGPVAGTLGEIHGMIFTEGKLSGCV